MVMEVDAAFIVGVRSLQRCSTWETRIEPTAIVTILVGCIRASTVDALVAVASYAIIPAAVQYGDAHHAKLEVLIALPALVERG